MQKYLEFLYFLSIARKRTAFRFMASWPNNGPRLFVNVFTLSNDIILLLKPTLSASASRWGKIFFKVAILFLWVQELVISNPDFVTPLFLGKFICNHAVIEESTQTKQLR